MRRRFPYPRWHIFRKLNGWHVWFIPEVGCIKEHEIQDSFDEAWMYLDYLKNKEPS